MTVSVDLLADLSIVVITRDSDVDDAIWALLSQGVLDSGGDSHASLLKLSWADFLGYAQRMAFTLRDHGVVVEYTPVARKRINKVVEESDQVCSFACEDASRSILVSYNCNKVMFPGTLRHPGHSSGLVATPTQVSCVIDNSINIHIGTM